MFVGGLSYCISEQQLFAYFSLFARVSNIVMIKDEATGMHRGFGFVTIDSAAAAEVLVHSKNYICGRRVECQLASQHNNKSQVKSHMKLRRLFVSNIPANTSNQHLDQVFSRFGETHNCYIIQKTDGSGNKPYGFVEFENADDAQRLLHLQPSIYIGNNLLLVKSFKDRQEQQLLKQSKAPSHDSSVAAIKSSGESSSLTSKCSESAGEVDGFCKSSFYCKYPISGVLNQSVDNYIFKPLSSYS